MADALKETVRPVRTGGHELMKALKRTNTMSVEIASSQAEGEENDSIEGKKRELEEEVERVESAL